MLITAVLATVFAEASDTDGDGSVLIVMLGIVALVAGIWLYTSRRHPGARSSTTRADPGEQPGEFVDDPTPRQPPPARHTDDAESTIDSRRR